MCDILDGVDNAMEVLILNKISRLDIEFQAGNGNYSTITPNDFKSFRKIDKEKDFSLIS